MRCSVPKCSNDSDTKPSNKSDRNRITFHLFPRDPNLRNEWLQALGMSHWEPKGYSTICSEHFRQEDFFETSCGSRKITKGATPVPTHDFADDLDGPTALRVCRICLDTDSKMYNIRDHTLEQAFTEVSGVAIGDKDKLPQRVCWECRHRLLAASRFRSKVLRTHDLLTGLPHASPNITIRDICSINRCQNSLRSQLTYKYYDHNDYHTHIIEDDVTVKSETNETDDVEEIEPLTVVEVEFEKDEKKNITVNKQTGLLYKLLTANDVCNDDTGNDACNDDEDSEDKLLRVVNVKKRKVTKRKVKVKKERVVKKRKKEDSPKTTTDKSKNNLRSSKTADIIDKTLFTITTPSYDEQKSEFQKRQESTIYKRAPYKCTVCYLGFFLRDRYDAHVVKHSEQYGAYECFICKNRQKTARALRQHLMACHKEKYSCNRCTFVTKIRNVAREHENWHAGKKYQCPLCPSVFDKVTTYKGHMRIKHVCDFACELCGYTFVSKMGVDFHKKRKHRLADKTVELEGPYCEKCEVRFLSEEAHSRHLQLSSRHNSDSNPSIRNESQNVNAERSGRIVQKGERRPIIYKREGDGARFVGPVSCEQCGMQLKNLRLYALHFIRAHPDKNRTKYQAKITPYMCEQCGRIYQNSTVLKDHMWVHTGEKGFKCDLCDKSFTQKSSLAHHMQVHSESRPSYECPLCGKHFAFFNNMKKHMFIHTGLKPFKCELCGKCFTTGPQQRAHVEHVHLKKPWPKRQRDTKPRQECLDPMED